MKVLLVSDLHCDPAKLDWIRDQASAFDVIVVAGDLLDIFMPENSAGQKNRVLGWRSEVIASGPSLVWSSGNHDFFNGEDSPIVHASPDWMVGSGAKFRGDGMTSIVDTKTGSLAVTTIPWPVTGADITTEGRAIPYTEYVDHLLAEGKRLQRSHPWLVLFHEPPIETRLSVGYEAVESHFSRQILEKWSPDWSLHGHVHESALHPDGDFIDYLSETACFNAGQSPQGDEPHYIVLRVNGPEWSARWGACEQSRHVHGVLPAR